MKRRHFIKKSIGTSMIAALPLFELKAQVNKSVNTSIKGLPKTYDFIVIGVGSMGSATCYHLAKRGYQVLGLEQFDIPHELGSHSGQSRIIRKAYFEHPDYVPLLERAYHNWKSFEEETGTQLYHKTGMAYFAPSDHLLISGIKESAMQYSIEVNDISSDVMNTNYSQFRIPKDYARLIEPNAGIVTPERAILLYAERALQLGAQINTQEKTLKWKKKDEAITIQTDKNEYQCKKLILTTGAWIGNLLPDFNKNLTVTRQMTAWIKPKNWTAFELGNFPCWAIADKDRPSIYYGFPIMQAGKHGGPIGMKVAHHFHGEVTDPLKIDRTVTNEDKANLTSMLSKFIPEGYKSIHEMKACMYTNTADEHFILDFVPGYEKDVVMAAGFSGHGFKFVSVVGEILADMVLNGSTDQPIGFLNARRFNN